MAVEKRVPDICNYAMFCPGCGHGVILRLICECIEEMGLTKEVIAAIGVGCSCHLKSGIGCDLVQSPHGRAAAVATGIRRAEPTKFVFTYQGDGDAYNIGIAETLNAAYRNENICVFVVNNSNFGMTGGQMSWCTLEGQKTATSPAGRDCSLTGLPIMVPEMVAHSFQPAYVARGAVTTPAEINRLKGYIKNAFEAQLNHEGYSLVEILSTCPTNWGMDPLAAQKHLSENVSAYYKLGEFKKRGIRMREVLFAGFGGQGVLTAGLILSQIALYSGNNATWMPSYGAAMRGGTANCTVHYGEGTIYNPGQQKPDLLLAMNTPSFKKFAEIVRPGGIILYNSDMMTEKAEASEGIKLVGVPCNQIADRLKNPKGANIVMMGAIIKLLDDFSYEAGLSGMNDMFRKKGKAKFEEKNSEAFRAGYEAIK